MNKTCVVFDLDDTLFKERDFLKSAYRHIADKLAFSKALPEEIFQFMYDVYRQGKDVFSEVLERFPSSLTKEELLVAYRNHYPFIKMDVDTKWMLNYLKDNNIEIGLLTDGRSVTQRNKIRALELYKYIKDSNIIISEEFGSGKPSLQNYQYFVSLYPADTNFIYVGDNPQKDFIVPNKLGWKTIGLLDSGENIHEQINTDKNHQPLIWIKKLNEIIPYLSN